jgi:hypothetical protein
MRRPLRKSRSHRPLDRVLELRARPGLALVPRVPGLVPRVLAQVPVVLEQALEQALVLVLEQALLVRALVQLVLVRALRRPVLALRLLVQV